MIVAVIANQFTPHGIRLPILIKSIPVFSLGSIPHISQEDALALHTSGKAVFVDTRSSFEFDMDNIEGAISLPVVDFISNPKLIDAYDKDKSLTVILYNAKEYADNEPILARFFKAKGVKDVRILEGGMEMWSKNNYPVGF